MNVQIEILDYEDRDKIFDSPKVIVRDSGPDGDMVRITVDGKTVKVSGTEMIKAIERCMKAQWPYY